MCLLFCMYIKQILKEIFKGIFFILFLMSAFWLRFKANDVKKMRSYPHFSLTSELVEFKWKYPKMFKFIIIMWWDQVIAHNSAVYLNASCILTCMAPTSFPGYLIFLPFCRAEMVWPIIFLVSTFSKHYGDFQFLC